MNLKKQVKQKYPKKKQQKQNVLKTLYNLFEGRERILNASKRKIFLIKIEGTGFSDKVSDHSNLKVLTPKQMLQRLLMALAKVKAVNTSENLLNEIRKIIIFVSQNY